MPNGQRELWLNRPCPSRICLAGRRITTEREQARVNSIFARSAIPPRYQDVRLSDFDDPRYYAGLGGAVLRARAEAKGLFLWGNVGAGKTSLAVAVLKERLAEGKAGLFIETPDLLDRIRRSYGDDGPNADEVIDASARPLLEALARDERAEGAFVRIRNLYGNGRELECLVPRAFRTHLISGY